VDITKRLLREWYSEKLEEPWFQFWTFLSGLAVIALIVLFPLAVIVAAVYGHYCGSAKQLHFVLIAAFWTGLAGTVSYVLGLVGVCWADMAAERLGEKRKTLTIQEITRKNLNFERWGI